MFYFLYSYSDDDFQCRGLFAGPAGLKPDKLLQEFASEFDYRTLGSPQIPPYYGPMKQMSYSGCSSGSIPAGTMIFDTDSSEYRIWNAQCEKFQKEWHKRRQDKIKLWQRKYEGKTVWEMGLSYLKKEHDLEEVEVELINC